MPKGARTVTEATSEPTPEVEPEPNTIVLARRRAGSGDVSIPGALPEFEGFEPDVAPDVSEDGQFLGFKTWWREGACIPMRYEEAAGRDDCDPVKE